ncbi:hypothetical protein ACHMW6_07490 [Pseudoduganella sp. UC29_106]|uniref:hypothetical protein n=1 Tax=Pseudoduganella sp. UC29_106 TaxID=3374553 RepID=UPI003756B258
MPTSAIRAAYRELSQKLQGRDIAQVILLHHNLINAMWLDDVIAQFKEMDWTITTPQISRRRAPRR